jgi:starch-binding outer membrane protein, SusD/RagB family
MKLKNILCALLCVIMVASSCKHDILELKPLDRYSDSDVFKDIALLTEYVNGVYRGMGHPFGGEGDKFIEGMTDDGYNQHGGSSNQYRLYAAGEIGSDQGESLNDNLWANSYDYIRRTNMFLEKAPASGLDADRLKTLTGEIRFFACLFLRETDDLVWWCSAYYKYISTGIT